MHYVYIAIAAVVALLVAVTASGRTSQSGAIVDAALLFAGAVLAFLATLVMSEYRRRQEKRDILIALHQEIADRAARCWFDFRQPWQGYLRPSIHPTNMDVFRLRKFRPSAPIIFPAIAPRIALLEPHAIAPVQHFFFRLDAWSRDIESFSTLPVATNVDWQGCRLMANRLGQTLQPALEALTALGESVSSAEEIERRAMAGYDDSQCDLRAALKDMIDAYETYP